jgi:hypothetical protein
MLDNNAFPPNVSLSPMNNSYLSSTNATHLEPNPMMMYSQQTPAHMQHHPNQNSMSNMFYRQTAQGQQQTMYNNFVQPPPPPNQVAPGYYPMQQQSSPQQRMSPATHQSQLNKRQTVMHHQQQQQQRTSQQNNQQLHLQMSMNVTLPNVKY